jgi:GrpB-like predicted nucleotidyltransferase (UPF0157 family)
MGRAERRKASLEGLARATGSQEMPVEVVEYDPSWPAAFEAERVRLEPLLEGAEIHHIGSTAVPGLAAKPIIDMMAVVDSYEVPITRLVADAGYQYPRAFNAALTNRRFLCYPRAQWRTHHMHLLDDPDELTRYLRFRDRLRVDPALAHRYEALKRELAERHRLDREAYSEGKSGFVNRHERTGASAELPDR